MGSSSTRDGCLHRVGGEPRDCRCSWSRTLTTPSEEGMASKSKEMVNCLQSPEESFALLKQGGFPGGAFAQSQGCSPPHMFGPAPLQLSVLHYPKTTANRQDQQQHDLTPPHEGASPIHLRLPSKPQDRERRRGLPESTPLPWPAPRKPHPKPSPGRGGCTASTPECNPPPHCPLPLSLPLNSLLGPVFPNNLAAGCFCKPPAPKEK